MSFAEKFASIQPDITTPSYGNLMLVATNLISWPALFHWWRKDANINKSPALIGFLLTLASIELHLCASYGYCILQLKSLYTIDVFYAWYIYPVMLMHYLKPTKSRWQSFFDGVQSFMMLHLVLLDFDDLYKILIVIGVSVIIPLLYGWRTGARPNQSKMRTEVLLVIVLGSAFCFYMGMFKNQQNYWFWHSLWHLQSSLVPYLLEGPFFWKPFTVMTLNLWYVCTNNSDRIIPVRHHIWEFMNDQYIEEFDSDEEVPIEDTKIITTTEQTPQGVVASSIRVRTKDNKPVKSVKQVGQTNSNSTAHALHTLRSKRVKKITDAKV